MSGYLSLKRLKQDNGGHMAKYTLYRQEKGTQLNEIKTKLKNT